MERFEVFNHKDEPLNKIVTRGESLKEDEYFRVVHVWIENNTGKYLIQQRAKNTDPIPYQWATTTGIPLVNESVEEAAIRETYEELGIKLDSKLLIKIAEIITTQSKYRTITHVFLYRCNITLKDVHFDLKEVLKVDYKSLEEILKMVQLKQFWDYRKLLNDSLYFSKLER